MRIIPMRVGTSMIYNNSLGADLDHPHACGDKSRPFLTLRPFVGSSPCVWGQDYALETTLCCVRIIPMRVGTRLG